MQCQLYKGIISVKYLDKYLNIIGGDMIILTCLYYTCINSV